jgi:Transmembrane secretion effector
VQPSVLGRFRAPRALRTRGFALLWSGQAISRLGDSFFTIALMWWVLQETGSALVLGTVLMAETVPMLALSLLGGALVDRLPRVWVMWASDIVRGCAVCGIAILAFSGTLSIWAVYAASVVMGCVAAVFPSAYRAVVPELVEVDDLPSANALTNLSRQATGIVGPALAASLVAVGGSHLAFLLDGLSFFVASLCLLPLARMARSPRRVHGGGILDDVREGLAAVWASPWLWVTIGVAGISNLTYAGPMGAALPFLVRDHLRADVGVLGLFYSVNALGAVVAATWLAHQVKIRHRGPKLYGAWMVIGMAVVVMGLVPSGVLVFLAAAAVIGAANTILGLLWVMTVQEDVPRHLQGRVSSIDFLGSRLLEPVGLSLGGWATDWQGAAPVFILGGCLHISLVALGLLHPQVRRTD